MDEAVVKGIAGSVITVDDASLLPDYLALHDRELLVPLKVLSVAGNAVSVSETVDGVNNDDATLCALRMCRFASDSLQLSFEK